MAETRPMGIGVIGQPDIRFKRNFRYTFEIFGFCNNEKNVVPEHFVNVAARPNLSIEETQIDHLNARTWIPAKAYWETITVTYLDVAHIEMRPLWNWMATLYDFTDPVNLKQGERRDWAATGVVSMFDACGTLLETWEMRNMFPTSINFGTLDYTSPDISTIEMTLRYSDVRFRSYCPDFVPEGCCTGCAA